MSRTLGAGMPYRPLTDEQHAALVAVLDAPTAGEHQAAQSHAVTLFGQPGTVEAWDDYLAARDALTAARRILAKVQGR